MLDTINKELLSCHNIFRLEKFLHDLANTEDMSRLTPSVGKQVLHPVCYGQPYKIKHIGYYPAVTLVAMLDIKKKGFLSLTWYWQSKKKQLALKRWVT